MTGQLWVLVDAETRLPVRFCSGPDGLERARAAKAELEAHARRRQTQRTVEARARLLAQLRQQDRADEAADQQEHNTMRRQRYSRRRIA